MPPRNPSFLAGGDIRPCRFVSPDPSNDYKVLESNAGDLPCGVAQEGYRAPNLPDQTAQTLAASSGDQVVVHGEGEVCLLEVNGNSVNIAAGDLLESDANGFGVKNTTGTAVGAKALESCTADAVKIKVQVLSSRAYA